MHERIILLAISFSCFLGCIITACNMVNPELEFYCEPEKNCHVAMEPRFGQKGRVTS